jgi:hypothetical protein
MSKMKNKYFDEINTGMEKARLVNLIATIEPNDFSPVYVINKIIESNSFRLTNEEITETIRNYYKF